MADKKSYQTSDAQNASLKVNVNANRLHKQNVQNLSTGTGSRSPSTKNDKR